MLKQATVTVMLLSIGLGGCNRTPADSMADPIAAIEDKILSKRQLYDAVPDNMSKEDSAVFAQDYINRWVKSQLMLRKAELNLTPAEKDVDKLLEEYRMSLLTNQYQQKLLEQKHTPMITGSEIEAYYTQMRENFKLNDPIVKGLFIKLPVGAPKTDEIVKWARSTEAGDLVNLEAYCYQYAKKFDSFLDTWRPLDGILQELPLPIASPSDLFRNQHFYQTQDFRHIYLISIREISFEDEYAPLDYVSNNIKSILLNKKRIEFIRQLEEDIYEEGLKQKVVKFY